MTDLTKLADEWRDSEDCIFSGYPATTKKCADQLESALPKWVKITDDSRSWPAIGAEIMYMTTGHPHALCTTARGGKPKHMTHWRPLCSIDYPPTEDSE